MRSWPSGATVGAVIGSPDGMSQASRGWRNDARVAPYRNNVSPQEDVQTLQTPVTPAWNRSVATSPAQSFDRKLCCSTAI